MPITPRQSASIRRSWTRLSSASPKKPSTSPRTSQRTGALLAREGDLHVVLVRAASHRQDDAPRAAHLDHAAPEVRDRLERAAGETQDSVAAPEPDAGDGAPRTDLRHGQAVVVGVGREAEPRPEKAVGVRGREGG